MIDSEKKIIYDCVKNALNNAENHEEVSTTFKLTQSDLYYLSSLIENDMKWNETKETTPFDELKGKWINRQGGFWGIAECSLCHENTHLVALNPIITLITGSLWNKEAFLRFFIFVYGSIGFELLYHTATQFVKRKMYFFYIFLFSLKPLDKQTPLCYTILVR